jgi:beta-lactamase class A
MPPKVGRYVLLAALAGVAGYAGLRLRAAPEQVPVTVQTPLAPVPTWTPPDPDAPPGPGCVTPRSTLAAPPPPPALSGQLGLYVAVIDPRTLEPLRAVAYAPQAVFPLASTYKQAVLWALLRQVDAGTFDLKQKFSVSRASQSLGPYPYDGSTARQLAERMILYSDNTATDLLHRKVGLQNVQDVADRLGLCRTRLILPTKDWWTAQSGLSNTYARSAAWPGATGADRLRLAQGIDADAQKLRPDYLQHRLDQYFDTRYNAIDDLKAHNLSTPYELSTLVAHEFLQPGLSPTSQNLHRKLMALGFGKSALLPIPVAEFGGKGGNGWKILTYSGYFKTKGGEHVVYAFMLHGSSQTYTMKLTRHAFSWIRAAAGEILVAGDGGKPVAVVAKKGE